MRIYQVDAFTDRPFGGNPAGVVPEAEGLSDIEMQKIAREMNLSETAFVFDLRRHGRNDPGKDGLGKPTTVAEPEEAEPGVADPAKMEPGGAQRLLTERGYAAEGKDRRVRLPAAVRVGSEPLKQPSPDFRVRFFTPQTEVDLCGHATIGTFFLLAKEGWIRPAGPAEGADLPNSGVAKAWSTDAPGRKKEAGDDVFMQRPLQEHPASPGPRDDLPPPPTVIYQETKAGLLPVEIHWRSAQTPSFGDETAEAGPRHGGPDRKGSGNKVLYEVDRVMMHQRPPEFLGRVEDVAELAEILGLAVEEIGAVKAVDSGEATPIEMPVEIVSTGLPDLIVPVVNQEALNRMKPDLNRLKAYCERLGVISVHAFCLPRSDQLPAVNSNGQALSSSGGPEVGGPDIGPGISGDETVPDAVCRDFAPAVGIPEEAATGTASGALGAYLVAHGVLPGVGSRVGPGPESRPGSGMGSRPASGTGSRVGSGLGKIAPQRMASQAGLFAPGTTEQNRLLREGAPEEWANEPGQRSGESTPGAIETRGTAIIEGGAALDRYRFLFSQGVAMGRPSLIEVEVEVALPEKTADAATGSPMGSLLATGTYENIVRVKVGGRAVKVIEGWVWMEDKRAD